MLGGSWLRYRDVNEQVLGGDEFHAIRMARDHSLAELLTHYEAADSSVAVNVYARVLMDTVGLTEFNFRMPVILSGVLLLLAPIVFRRRFGPSAALVTIALVAASPNAIYHSFVGRPYGPAAVLLLSALWAWWHWLRRPSAGLLALFVASSAFAVFLHLLCVLPVGVLVGLSWVASRRPGGPPVRRVLGMTAVLLLAGLALLGPGLSALIETRLVAPTLPTNSKLPVVWLAFANLAGEHTSTALMLILFGAIGSVRMLRRDVLLGVALASVLPAVAAGLFLLPVFPSPAAFARYMFLVWPMFLMTVAVGMVGALAAVQRQLAGRPIVALLGLAAGCATVAVRWGGELGSETAAQFWMPWIPGLILAVGACDGLLTMTVRRLGAHANGDRPESIGMTVLSLVVAAGMIAWTPVPILRPGPDSLRVRRDSLKLTSDATRREWARDVAPFFHEIADADDAGDTVLVWPYRVPIKFWQPFVRQQLVHGRRVVGVQLHIVSKLLPDGADFDNVAELGELGDLVDEGARYLVMCLSYPEDWGDASQLGSYYSSALRPLLEGRHGPPVYRDEHIEVFDLWIQP